MVDNPKEKIKPDLNCVLPVHDLKHRIANVKSILKNTPLNVKIILVHDRGINASEPAVCVECSSLVPENSQHLVLCGGFSSPGKARNFSMEHLDARWTCFVDSDDQVDFYEILESIKKADLADKEIFVAEAKIEYQGIERKLGSKTIQPLSNFAANPGLWRCGFITKRIRNLNFPEMRWGEDQVFLAKALQKSSKTPLFLNTVVYSYIRSDKSQISSNEEFWIDLYNARAILKTLITQPWPSKYNQAIVQLINVRMDFSCLKRSKSITNWKELANKVMYISNPWFLLSLIPFIYRILKSKSELTK
jgi:hypothetical protein